MLEQKPCGKGFLQLPPEKPAARGVEWGTDLTPGFMQNNMGIFLNRPSTSLGSRAHASAGPPPLVLTHTHQELPGAVHDLVSLFKSRECGVIS